MKDLDRSGVISDPETIVGMIATEQRPYIREKTLHTRVYDVEMRLAHIERELDGLIQLYEQLSRTVESVVQKPG